MEPLRLPDDTNWYLDDPPKVTPEQILERIVRGGIEIGFKGNDACVVGNRWDVDPHKLAELLAEIINKQD